MGTPLEPIGTLAFIPSIVCIILVLQWGGTILVWSDPRIIILLIVFGALFRAFCEVQVLWPANATVSIHVIRKKSVTGSAIFASMQAGSMLLAMYFLLIWFQAVREYSAMQSGIRTIPMVLSQGVMAILSSGVTQKIGYYVPGMVTSSVLTSVAGGLLSITNPAEDQSHWIGYECLYGFGTGMAAQTSNLAVQTVLPQCDISTGVTLVFFAQHLGGTIIVSVSVNILTSAMVTQLSNVADFGCPSNFRNRFD